MHLRKSDRVAETSSEVPRTVCKRQDFRALKFNRDFAENSHTPQPEGH